jgi:hypothetical protein
MLEAGYWRNSTHIPPAKLKKNWVSKMIKFCLVLFSLMLVSGNAVCQKKPLTILMQSLQFLIPGKVWAGYTIGRGLDAILPFTC